VTVFDEAASDMVAVTLFDVSDFDVVVVLTPGDLDTV